MAGGSVLTSLKNPKVAAAARLKKRAFREEDRRFLVEGAQAVREALDEPGRLGSLFATDVLDPLVVRAGQAGVDVYEVATDVMARLTSTVTPQGLVGHRRFLDVGLDDVPDDGVPDAPARGPRPGERRHRAPLGRCRGCGRRGLHGLLGRRVQPQDRARVARARTSTCRSCGAWRRSTRSRRCGPAGSGCSRWPAEGADDLYRTDLSGPVAFLFGNEAHGLPPEVIARADGSVRVPQAGRAESLNLAAAATVCLFEWARRRARQGEALESIIAAAAHDIRSPLTAMKGFGYALEKRWEQMTEDQRALMLRGIVHDADRMDTILRHLVDAARVVGGTLELFPEQVDVAELVRAIAEAMRRDPDHPPIEYEGEPVTVFVDPARLKTTILAFIESLVWWGREGPVRIGATPARRDVRASGLAAGDRARERSGRGAVHAASPRGGRGQQDRPVRGPGGRRGAGRPHLG